MSCRNLMRSSAALLLVSALVLLLAPPGLGTMLLTEDFTCPLCGTVYPAGVVVSTNTLGGQDSEFRRYALGMQPLEFLVHTCPACGCPDLHSLFPGAKPPADGRLSPTDKDGIRRLLQTYCRTRHLKPKDFTASQRFEVLAEVLLLRGAAAALVAPAYLKAAWMADDRGESERAVFCRRQAAQYFQRALETGEISPPNVPLIRYLIGEIYRRAGDFAQALLWFDRTEPTVPILPRLLASQRQLARRKISEKSMITKKF
jgi:uncharacterized protein (DUF2225 family)